MVGAACIAAKGKVRPLIPLQIIENASAGFGAANHWQRSQGKVCPLDDVSRPSAAPYGCGMTANACLIASGEILNLRSIHDMKSAGCTITSSLPSGLARMTQ